MRVVCLSSLCLAFMLAFAVPAAAQSRIQLVAVVVGGLADGVGLSMGTLGPGTVRKDAENAFEAVFGDGVASFEFGEPRDCVFTERSTMKGQPTTLVYFNFNLVEAIDYLDQGQLQGFNAYVLQMTGSDSIVQVAEDADDPESELVTSYPFASLMTSLPLDDFKAAAAALKTACPGIPAAPGG